MVIWLLMIGILTVTATTNPVSAVIGVVFGSFTGIGVGISFAKMMRLYEPHHRYDRRHLMDIPFYILKDRTPVPVPDWETWAQWMHTHVRERIVQRSSFESEPGVEQAYISTAFLGIGRPTDPKGRPLLFETLVFGSPMDGWSDRYASYDDAVDGHAATTLIVKALLDEINLREGTARERRKANAHLN